MKTLDMTSIQQLVPQISNMTLLSEACHNEDKGIKNKKEANVSVT